METLRVRYFFCKSLASVCPTAIVVTPMVKTHEDNYRELASIRDTVESIWVAIVLAFVLRAFMIEAFVIPTGSMAPRLLGDHRALQCPSCGYRYAFGFTDRRRLGRPADRSTRRVPVGAQCPNCNYPFRRKAYVDSGDRVLVLKYLYQFREPRPWDVIVFKNPQNNRENYIKRLIGLPGETIEIVNGDIFVRKGENGPWKIRRKPPIAQAAMWQVVFDNDYRPDAGMIQRFNAAEPDAEDRISPPRWAQADETGAWELEGSHGRRFRYNGKVPAALAFVPNRKSFLPTYGYNAWARERGNMNEAANICSDLRLSVMFVPKDAGASVTLRLTSLENEFIGRVSADGTLELSGSGSGETGDGRPWSLKGKVDPIARGIGCDVALVHVDSRVELWVGSRRVLATSDREYRVEHGKLKARLSSGREIPRPSVSIAGDGGRFDLWHVRLLRDVYYTSPILRTIPDAPLGDYARARNVQEQSPGWGTTGRPIRLRKYPEVPNRDMDEFFCMGDNSPQSHDGRTWLAASPTLRLWEKDGKILHEYKRGAKPLYQIGTVPRYLLIGKALFVYWPSGFRLPGLPGLPIIPNVGRMRLIR